MAYKTVFTPKHPEKYVGDVTNIICRSLWERKFAKYCDETPGVLRWGSEELVIPYVSPLDGRVHRYFTDFYLEVKAADGGVKTFVIEVKPDYQTRPPQPPKRKTKRFLYEAATFAKNQAKWQAAQTYCRERGWTFLVLTEAHLFGTFK